MAAALLLFATAPGFIVLLAATTALATASGAFVSLSQATWMDMDPRRTAINMARWVVAGSIGAVAGPLVLSACAGVGLGWRSAFAAFAVAAAALAVSATHLPSSSHPGDAP